MAERFIMFDCKLRRPGCVLIQAAYGVDAAIAHEFPADTWLTAPTSNMARYKIDNDDQLRKLVEIAIAATAQKQGLP